MASETKLLARIQKLEACLKESNETLAAIRKGEVDAFVVRGRKGEKIYTLKGADHPYRVLVQDMREGAVTLAPDGVILYSNRRFAELVRTPLERVIGSRLQDYVDRDEAGKVKALLRQGTLGSSNGEAALKAGDSASVPVFLSFNHLQIEDVRIVCLVVTDLTEQKRAYETLAAERLARAILDQAAEAVIVADHSGKILRASRAAAALGDDDLLLRQFDEVFPLCANSGSRSRIRNARDLRTAACQGQTIRGLEAVLPRLSKPPAYLLCSAGPLLGPNAEPLGCVITLTDITVRRRIEDELRQASDTVRAIVAGAPVAIWLLDNAGKVVLWNPAAESLFGYTAADVTSEPGLFHVRTPSGRDVLDRLAKGEIIVGLEAVCEKKNGARVNISLSTSVLHNPDGTSRGFVALALDVTEQKRLEQQIRQAQKLESIGLLAGGIAHDFNNLLTGIIGNASLAIESIPEESRELLQGVMESGQRAASLTRQLLAYAGKGHFYTQALDVSSVVRRLLPLIRTSLPTKAEVSLDLPDALPAIRADRSQLEQVIMNLVINAGEALEGSGRITIRTWTQDLTPQGAGPYGVPPGRYACLEVSDTGCGMDEGTRARIFEPFFTTKFTGRGLGLAAVHGIVRSCAGGIKVVSEKGKGSCFTLLFPAMEEPAGAEAPELKASPREAGVVLVADDEELVLSMARTALERHGLTVITASNGKEAVDIFREAPEAIDAVLLDIKMPVMDGREAFRELKRIRPDVKVLVSSGYNEAEALRGVQRGGVDGFLQKPYTATVLAEAVKSLISG